MNRARLREISLFVALLLMSALLLQFVWHSPAIGKNDGGFRTDNINLALRRTAHLLLEGAGDSTSRIPPVEQLNSSEWLVRLEHNFDYDRLPIVLQESFDMNGIHKNYDVAVLRCSDSELQLGYNFLEFSTNQNQSATCGGREMLEGCYNLKVMFRDAGEKQGGLPLTGWFVSGILAFVFYGVGRKWRQVAPKPEHIPADNTEWLHFGNSRLDVPNQLLICGAVRHNLTYREAKLLHLFASNPNQLLERNHILENVWADEGILVGRSVDMFVSRLRKMLRDDASLGLVAVHGVGYRLEVAGITPPA